MKINTAKAICVCLIAVVVGACASNVQDTESIFNAEPVLGPPPELTRESRRELENEIRKHVRREKHWADAEYEIKLKGGYSKVVVIDLIHRDDTGANARVGGGKSGRLHISLVSKKILKELGFQ